MQYYVGDYVNTKNDKSGKIRSMYNRNDSIVIVILLKDNSCYVFTLEHIQT